MSIVDTLTSQYDVPDLAQRARGVVHCNRCHTRHPRRRPCPPPRRRPEIAQAEKPPALLVIEAARC